MSEVRSGFLRLPAVSYFKQRSDTRNGWSDHYGALDVALAYAELRHHDGYFNAIWQHGCHPPWRTHSPGLLAYNSPALEELAIFVAKMEQVELLAGIGVKNVRAIGLPIVYTRSVGRSRRKGSLVVFPTHTLSGESYPDRTPFKRYAEEIGRHAKEFKSVVVCVHPSCIQNGLWVDEFKAIGVPVIEGANTSDRNALIRMRALFEQVETMTTNGWGSHVAYALAFGTKVSICGSKPERGREHYENDTTWQADLKAMEHAFSTDQAMAEQLYLQKLFVEPTEAIGDLSWGREMIGWEHRIAPEMMRTLLQEAFRVPLERSLRCRLRNIFMSH